MNHLDKKKLFKKPWIPASFSIVVIIAFAAGIFCGRGIFLKQNKTNQIRTNQTMINQNSTNQYRNCGLAVTSPHIKVNDRVFWTKSYETSVLPSNYKPVGKILSCGDADGNGSDLKNFQASFGYIGSVVYMDPSNPYAAYLGIVSSKKKSANVYVPTNAYDLYVTRDILDSIYYNGNLYTGYENFGNMTDRLKDFKCVGTVKSVDYTKNPSHNFESNILKSLGCRIYASETDKNKIYYELDKYNFICLKLNRH